MYLSLSLSSLISTYTSQASESGAPTKMRGIVGVHDTSVVVGRERGEDGGREREMDGSKDRIGGEGE
jgi:hypothetical protein